MRRRVRRRFWVESALSGMTGVLAVITTISRGWIEVVFGIDPDHGSGALEVGTVAAFGAAMIVAGIVARSEWRRAAATLATSTR